MFHSMWYTLILLMFLGPHVKLIIDLSSGARKRDRQNNLSVCPSHLPTWNSVTQEAQRKHTQSRLSSCLHDILHLYSDLPAL